MKVARLVTDLIGLGVKLQVKGDQLHFSAPRGVLTTEIKSKLSQHKDELIDFLKQLEKSQSFLSKPLILSTHKLNDLRLSYAQERLWLVDQWEPNQATYNISDGILIDGRISLITLEQCFNVIVRRHEVLRTNFVVSNGQPIQKIAPEVKVSQKIVEIDHSSYSDDIEFLDRYIETEISRPFNLAEDPLFRVLLIKLGPEKHILLMNLHHIISDGWSTDVLIKELLTLYHAFSEGEPSPFSELPIQYGDFAEWQRDWMAGDRLKVEMRFWRQQLEGSPGILILPTDRPRPKVRTFNGAAHRLVLSNLQVDDVRNLSRVEGVTPFMVLLAAWQILLSRYAGHEDILVGSPFACRNRSEIEHLIGFFVNTLVLRVNLCGNSTFKELLYRVRQVTVAAQEHQDLPFEKLVEELQPNRNTSHSPIFQVAFVFQNATTQGLRVSGLSLTRLDLPIKTTKFDLTMRIMDESTSMEVAIEYNEDLFDSITIERMLNHFQVVLAEMIRNPHQRLGDLSILTDGERTQVISEWNSNIQDQHTNKCLHELFEDQVILTPDAIAVSFEDSHLTYSALNCRSNQLARWLNSHGVEREIVVGLCLERSLEMVIGTLAILKSGAAYLPLDPEYPKERLRSMLDDASAKLLLSQKSIVESMLFTDLYTLCIDSDWKTISCHSNENLISTTTADNLAYVIYTSGSSGRPKGVAVEHRSVLNLLSGLNQAIYKNSVHEQLRVSLNGSLSFDTSVKQLIQLLHGHIIQIAASDIRMNGKAMLSYIDRNQVDVLDCTPSQLRILLDQGMLSRGIGCPSLVLVGGEAIDQLLWKSLAQTDKTKYYNLYGPTECTVDTTISPIDNNLSTPVIGRPILNSDVYILDKNIQPVPVGVPGELFIGGACLARGYLYSPMQTAEKFVPHPFPNTVGARLYKSGDKVRYKANGDIEYLERVDRQIKVRGFRIEPGEIETTLLQYPGIRKAAVIAQSNDGTTYLSAYLLCDKEIEDKSILRKYLQSNLPHYMVPNFFIALDEFPLTTNGKLDLQKLPLPEMSHLNNERKSIAPRTPTEDLLMDIWMSVLKREQIGVNDNFFDLGGHSLLGTQLMSRINDSFQMNLPLRELFEYSTVAELAERIQFTLTSQDQSRIPPIKSISRDEAIPLSYSQENLWLYEQLSPGTPTYTTCRSGRVWGKLNAIAVETVFNTLLQRHESLRTSFLSVDGTPVQVINQHNHFSLPVIDISGLTKDDRETIAFRLSNECAQQPIYLTESPIASTHLLRLDSEEHVFILSIHHIAYDLWSGGVLLEEIEQAYLAYSEGRPLLLPALLVQYADFAEWQRRWLEGEVFERQLSYWKSKLTGLPAIPLELPTDRNRPVVETMRGASIYPRYQKSLGENLRSLAQRESATQFIILLAIFQVLLRRYTNQNDIAVGSVITNRNRVELERVIGFFDNTILLRVDASGNPSFRDFLHRVRETALGAYTNPHLPFDVIVKELQPERSLNRSPLIQLMFIFFLNYPAMEREVAGLKVVPYKLNSEKARFDISFGFRESEQGIVGEIAYNCDLFDETTMIRMSGHFGRLIESVVSNPDQRLSELPILTDSECHELTVILNDTSKPYSQDKCLHTLIEAQAKTIADAVIIVCDNTQISYKQLNQRANQVAHYLRRNGVKPEDRVGICLPRSIEMVISILGVLKAGGAYVPLDPHYPNERIAYILDDSNINILVTEERELTTGLDLPFAKILTNDDWRDIYSEGVLNPSNICHCENLAYIIYTSGSTGKPKGVGVTHKNTVAFLNWAHDTYPENAVNGLLASTSVCFDLSIYELFLPLCFGGRIILVENILTWLSDDPKETVTLINTVPSVVKEALLVNSLPLSIEIINLAGESLSQDLAQQLYAQTSVKQIYNLYGPSETTTYSTCALVSAGSNESITIGEPISNTQIYVVNQELSQAPKGIYGEICISGFGLSRGYLNRPELTSEKFQADPFSFTPGARMYRTGDIARWLLNGKLEFTGRVDQQVKIRGYRIELGEIESTIKSHPLIREAVVIVTADPINSDKRLVGYIVAIDEQLLDKGELRAYLKGKLPEYMIPGAFIILAKLPLTPSGKLNRKALSISESDSIQFASPNLQFNARDEIEFRLLGIWQKILGCHHLSIRDRFFDIGGHSLLAVKLMTQVRKEFGKNFPLNVLIQYQTIESLAHLIRQESTIVHRHALLPIRQEGTRHPFFCVHPIGGNVMCYANLVRHLDQSLPFYAFQLPDLETIKDLNTIEDMASYYLKYLLEVQPQAPYRLGGWSMGGVIAFEMARQLAEQHKQVEMVALIDSAFISSNRRFEDLSDSIIADMFIRDLCDISGNTLDLKIDASGNFESDNIFRSLLNQMKSLDLIPSDFGEEEVWELFMLYRTNLKALLIYKPKSYDGKLTLFKASASSIEQPSDFSKDWHHFASGGVDVLEIECDHYSIMDQPNIESLAEQLNQRLS